ncbi:hypothetical protein, partial [Clostridium tagluense]|uniref:hypothetical protein n=1 Tax=Clostridium tagluense TaxID=360422 RepID=UPI001C6E2A8B
ACDKKRLLLETLVQTVVWCPSSRDIPIQNCVGGNSEVGCMRKSLNGCLVSTASMGKGKVGMVYD